MIAYSLSNDDRKSTVFSSRRNVVSDGAFLTDDGRLFHARAEATGKARSPSAERLVNGTTSMVPACTRTVRPAWLCQQNADGVEYRHQMSGEGPEHGTSALLHEERTAGMRLAPELATNGAHEAMGLCVLTASLRKPNGRRRSRRSAGLAACQRYRRESSCSSSPC